MDDTKNDNFISDYEDMLISTPQEVRDFLWSDGYKGNIDAIAKYCNLTDIQKTAVSDLFFDIVVNASDEIDAEKRLTDVGISEANQATIFALGYSYLVDPSLQITQESIDEAIEERKAATINGPVPLATLANRLKQASVTAPTTRAASLIRPTTGNATIDPLAETPSSAPRTIDPYHEAVDNE